MFRAQNKRSPWKTPLIAAAAGTVGFVLGISALSVAVLTYLNENWPGLPFSTQLGKWRDEIIDQIHLNDTDEESDVPPAPRPAPVSAPVSDGDE